ncbi:MAG: hypothetical protein ACM3UN_02900 [Bacillota bacterium]
MNKSEIDEMVDLVTSDPELKISRVVNILDATFSTPDYNTSITYIYDKASGMLLESTTRTITQAESQPITTTISYSTIETNIFTSNSSPSVFEFSSLLFVVMIMGLIVIAMIATKKRRQTCK